MVLTCLYKKYRSFLPPASAVEVIELVPSVCVFVCLCVFVLVSVSIMPKGLSAKVTVHEGNAGGKSTLRHFHYMLQLAAVDSGHFTQPELSLG